MNAPVNKSELIASLNDRFRSRLGIPTFGEAVPGLFTFTEGIHELRPVTQIELWQQVREFSDFTEDNDPYGEHDFGAFDHPDAGKVFWKTDIFADDQCQWGSEHPDDPTRSFRVLTIMLAEEY